MVLGGSKLGEAVLTLSTDNKGLDAGLRKGEQSTKAWAGRVKSLGTVALAAVAMAGAGAFAMMISEAQKAQKVAAQTNAVLESTGHAAGMTAEEVKALAREMFVLTGIEDDTVQMTENMLLTFTQIKEDTMPGATQAVLDMTVAMQGGGAQAEAYRDTAIRVGKALQDPIAGVTALRRVGVQLTDQQQEQVKAMMAVGDVAGAQAIVLGELTREFGGSAEAYGNTFAGQMQRIRNAIGDAAESFGTLLLPKMTAGFEAIAKFLVDNEASFQRWANTISAVVSQVFGKLDPLWKLFSRQDVAVILAVLFAGIVAGLVAVAAQAVITFITVNAALLGIPIAIAAVVAGIVMLVRHWDAVKAAVTRFVDKAAEFIQQHKVIAGVIIALSGPIGALLGGLILLVKNWGTVKRAVADAWSHITEWTQDAVSTCIGYVNALASAFEAAVNSIIKMVNAIPDIKVPGWVPGIGGKGWAIPDIPDVSIGVVPDVDLSGINLGGIGFDMGIDLSQGMAEGMGSPEAVDAAEYAATDVGDAAGAAAGAAAAESLVPAFVQGMAYLESLGDIIEAAISAREVRWADVARLYEMGATGIAEDFMAALTGGFSNIGQVIADAIAADAAAEAARAGMEAAQAFVDAFTQGMADLRSAIDAGFGAIGANVTSLEDAQLQLEILRAERNADAEIAELEAQQAAYLERIVQLEADRQVHIDRIAELKAIEVAETARLNQLMADEIAAVESRIAVEQATLAVLEDKLSVQQAELAAIREAADVQVRALEATLKAREGELKAIRASADAQVRTIEQSISANETILDQLRDQLKAKKETLDADKEALRTYEEAARVHEGIINDIERSLNSLQSEREQAWAILGMAPGGGALPPTLASAAQNLKDLQDKLAEMVAGGGAWDIADLGAWDEAGTAATDEFLALQDEIARATEIFNELDQQKQAEIEQAKAELETQQALLAAQQALIEQATLRIAQDEEAVRAGEAAIQVVQDAIDADKARIDAIKAATEELELAKQAEIDAIRANIDAVKDAAEEAERIKQAEIDQTRALIDATKDRIAEEREAITAIRDRYAADIQAIKDRTAAEIAAEQTKIDAINETIDAVNAQSKAVDATIAQIRAQIQALKDEQEDRRRDREIMRLQLEIAYDLYKTDAELNAEMAEQIRLAQNLQGVYDHLNDGIYDATDAIYALNAGLYELAALILQLVANPALGGLFPGFAAGGIVPGPRGAPTLALVHGGEVIKPAGGGGPVVTVNNTFNGTQNAAAVERATRRGVNSALRQRGLVA